MLHKGKFHLLFEQDFQWMIQLNVILLFIDSHHTSKMSSKIVPSSLCNSKRLWVLFQQRHAFTFPDNKVKAITISATIKSIFKALSRNMSSTQPFQKDGANELATFGAGCFWG